MRQEHTAAPLIRQCTGNAALAWLALWGAAAVAQDNYRAFELPREDNFAPLRLDDLNGDGRRDIVVPGKAPGGGRELLVYYQTAAGSFATPPQRIDIKSEIIAVGFADLRPQPGTELLLLADGGVFSLSAQIDGYVDNLRLLSPWQAIASLPDPETLPFLAELPDINADGLPDLALPGARGWELLYGAAGETFRPLATIATIDPQLTARQRLRRRAEIDVQLGIDARQGIALRLAANAPTPYAGLAGAWPPPDAEDENEAPLLRSETWLPGLQLAQLDGQSGLDVIYVNEAADMTARINIHFQRADGSFPTAPDQRGSMEPDGDWRVTDLDGDGLDDLLRLAGDGDNWTAWFHVNLGGRFDLEKPRQVMRFSGYDTRLELVSLPDRPRPVLAVSYYTVPVADTLRGAGVNRVQLVYAAAPAESGLLFARRPSTRLEERFSAGNVRGLSQPLSLRYDIDGDGFNDAMVITANGTLAARRLDADLGIAEQPFWEYVSSRTVFGYEVLSLNDDAIPDLLLRHGTVTTLLVGLP